MEAREVDKLRARLAGVSDPGAVLATLIAVYPGALAVYTASGARVLANAEFHQIFGRDWPSDYDVRSDAELARVGVLFWLRRAFDGESVTAPTFWYDRAGCSETPGSERVALSVRAFPIPDTSGNVEFVVTLYHDETDTQLLDERRRRETDELRRSIDARERADHERRLNEEQFRAIFEQTSDGVMITDDDGCVVDINPAGCRIFGHTRDAILGTRFWNHLANAAEHKQFSERLIRDGNISVDVTVQRSDGKERELEIRAVANFRPQRHLTTFRDVTEIRSSQAHLIASQRIAHVGSWEFDLDDPEHLMNNPLRATDECYRIYGYEPGSVELTPRSFFETVHRDDQDMIATKLRAAVETRSVYEVEHRITRTDGAERVVYSRAESLYDEVTGKPRRLIGTTQDVTERSRVRREIQQLNEELESRVAERTAELAKLNADLEAFAYSVSHDLRAPLRAINGYAQILLESREGLEKEPAEALTRIESSARRMDKLIDDLLAFSRLGRQAIQSRRIATAPIVREVLEELGISGATGRVEVVLGDLPEIDADPGLLKQVFANLVGNAVKFSHDSDPPRIEVGCSPAGGAALEWYVKDNGIGFDMEQSDRIFTVFQRLPTSEPHEGTGVGLAIVERIVSHHGGSIRAESEPGQGAAFYFTLHQEGTIHVTDN